MITVRTESGLRHSIAIGEHTLHADAPVAFGGQGSAPEPHDLFDASLGACKALTLMLYAKGKGMPLESIDVQVARDDSDERAGTYRLAVSLDLHGALTDEQRQQLLRIADKCPLHKLMSNATIDISTSLAAPAA
jgi:putative redox protein